ncbi:MAG: S-layer homology domain-containing protein [Bacillota bacterium]|nr:S-layer homology domain-containing protein [Bacillota bacterium]
MKKLLSIVITITMLFAFSLQAAAVSTENVNTVMADTAMYLYNEVSSPQISSAGGEWTILGLARSGADIPDEYYENYYQRVEKKLKECGGRLHDRKYTEYSRVILALTAIGKNPENTAGYNLLVPLGDYEKTVWQGVNGSIWALTALDSGGYRIPENPDAKIQAEREMYVNHILEKQNPEGFWGMSENIPDTDITAMALQALAKYKEKPEVKAAIEKALKYLSEKQNPDGGFSNGGVQNSESCAQVIVALCELNISIDSPKFVKNGNTVLDKMMTFYVKGKGFRHAADDSGLSIMSTEQCFYSLAALQRAEEGKNSLYNMSDADRPSENEDSRGLPGKNSDVKVMKVVLPGKTFSDITSDKNRTAIEELASRKIINGKTDALFEPESTMTRAEYAAIITRGLGLQAKISKRFEDVKPGEWFFDYVGTACSYGIVKGVSETCFNPYGTITREEAAVMTARAAKLCGLDTNMDTAQVRNILADFTDCAKASEWALESLAFCYSEGIIPDNETEIQPAKSVTRTEIALMLYNTLDSTKLL